MKDKSLKGVFMYRFGRNESALLLLALTIAAAGLYTRFTNEIAAISDYDSELGYLSEVRA